ncbi:MAG: PQQ-dependent sugar dehydrogenase [Acidobacteriales bacterium]|nr:PQQ-dependent sugar dehydrogenase [Terriglobales bacterium]
MRTQRWGFFLVLAFVAIANAQNLRIQDVPAAAASQKNPYAGSASSSASGAPLYAKRCAGCHGKEGQGSGNIPSLKSEAVTSASEGALFWYITHGSPQNGMPAWIKLPAQQRWQIVSYVKTLTSAAEPAAQAAASAPEAAMASKIKAPPPQPPFTDFRYEAPGRTRKITVADLPPPYATKSAGNGPDVVQRPANVWPQAPQGFKVEQFATGLDQPRLMRRAPNGDVFLAETGSGKIRVYRGVAGDGKAAQSSVFATGLSAPFGIAFYPPGDQPQFVYVGNTTSLVRFPYHSGDLKAQGPAQHILDLPAGGHDTRDVQFSLDGKTMYVAVGSASNVDDPDTHRGEKNRANILAMNPDGSGLRVYAAGIRNPVGIAVNPKTGEVWCSVNERDGLGDNLVPDYITHVSEGGFYGWPWWYMGAHQDPRHQGKRADLKDKVIVPDVLLQPHNASLEMTFYDGRQFPAEYEGDVFAAEHGSWNKAVRAGYEVIRVPLHQQGKASGEYQDFLTGFVLPDGRPWGRPVGVTVAADGALLVSDDGSNTVWRVSYSGKR